MSMMLTGKQHAKIAPSLLFNNSECNLATD